MKVNKKSWLALGGLAVASIVLAGCAGSGAPAETDEGDASTELTVWVDTERVDALKDAAEAYTEKTGVAVDLVGKDVDNIKNDFIQQAPTGRGPDVVMGAHDWLGELSSNGVARPAAWPLAIMSSKLEAGSAMMSALRSRAMFSTAYGSMYVVPS